jgi:branched-chain amino acid transport system substrate-binding protein
MTSRGVFLGLALTLAAGAAFAQGQPVRIGVHNDRSGLYADIGGVGSEVAARMAAEDFGGTVLGRPIEILAADNQNKADIASALTRKWIDAEGVSAVTDGAGSATSLASYSIAQETGALALISGAYASAFTGKACSPTGTQWSPNTTALANAIAKMLVDKGNKTFFFITVDYVFGHSMQKDMTDAVQAAGGRVVGSVKHPLNNNDFSSHLLQAQGSGADVIVLANGGGDMINSIKQAHEFALKQALVAPLTFVSDIESLGLQTAGGLIFADVFYWDRNEKTRAWSRRFMERHGGRAPTTVQAMTYTAVLHYLDAVQAAGTEKGEVVQARMRALPVRSPLVDNARVREDGRVIMDFFIAEAKKPAESKYAKDYYRILGTLPGEPLFTPLSASECPLVKKG